MIKKYRYLTTYFLIRSVGFFLGLIPRSLLHAFGKGAGWLGFHLLKRPRKRVLSNLAIAKKLHASEAERKAIGIEAFQNLAITSLEYFRALKSKDSIDQWVVCDNPEVLEQVYAEGKGFIAVSGHQANWETAFYCLSRHFPGIAVGRPVENPYLYDWVLRSREMFGGKIVAPKNALKEGVKALSKGKFFGVLNDQALPESSYSYPFLGSRAWSSTIPGLLAYKTGAPIINLDIYRKDGRYHIRCEEPFYPDQSASLKKEVIRLTDRSFQLMEQAVLRHPGQWLWQHNKWKQTLINHIPKRYRHDFILIIFPPDEVSKHLELVASFEKLYPKSFLTFFVHESTPIETKHNVRFYKSYSDIFIHCPEIQFVFNFYPDQALERHFLKQNVYEVINLKTLEDRSPANADSLAEKLEATVARN